MSHTSTIDSMVITDIRALRSAITDLQRAGVACELREKCTPRGYYKDQNGLGPADFVVYLNEGEYDVGLYYNEKIGGYETRADFFGRHISNHLGNPIPQPATQKEAQQYHVGKLFQAYGVCATEQEARSKGYQVRRSVKDDGTVQLQLSA